MPEGDKSSALTILTTEHYTLQMVRTVTITDAAGRAGHLLTTISASMIALGFAQVVPPQVLLALMLVILAGLFLIGLRPGHQPHPAHVRRSRTVHSGRFRAAGPRHGRCRG